MKIKKGNKLFYIEYTDLFGGELNYSFVNRFKIQAKSLKGAIIKLSKHLGLNFNLYCDYGDCLIYHSKTKLSGYTIQEIEPNDSTFGAFFCWEF
jgi:hypothetical protein